MEFQHLEKEAELLSRTVEDCLQKNGAKHAETLLIHGVPMDLCNLYPAEHYCKYAVVLYNEGLPQRLCLYEILHHEQ